MPPARRTRLLATGLLAAVASELAIAAVTALTSGVSWAAASFPLQDDLTEEIQGPAQLVCALGDEQNRPDRISHANVIPGGITGRTGGGRKRGNVVEPSFECIIVIGPTITHRTKIPHIEREILQICMSERVRTQLPVGPGVSAFWWRSCLAVPGTRLAAGLGA